MKNSKLFTAIYIILISLIFATEIVFIWANDAVLKNNLTVVAGLLVLIWLVFTIFYWIPGKLDFQNPKYSKLGRVAARMMLYTIIIGQAANTFVQDRTLGGVLLVVEGLIILVCMGIYVYDLIQRRIQIRREKRNNFESLIKNI